MRELLPLFQKPSRYLGTEFGAVHKDPTRVDVRIALAFPDLYEVAMSYMGQKILYSVINGREEFWAERVFSPSTDVADILREKGAELSTLESDTPLSRVDIVSFSITHELCYTNVLYMLELGGIPLHASERDEKNPLVIMGGGCAFNAEPLAPFVDVMVLGDGEEVMLELLDAVSAGKKEGLSRRDLLMRLKDIRGIYVPSFFEDQGRGKAVKPLIEGYERVDKAIVTDMNVAQYPVDQVMAFSQPIHDRLALELARGCTRGCRFCHAGIVYRPVRERTPEKLAELLADSLSGLGYEEISFLSLSTGDYSALDMLFSQTIDRCAAEQVSISLPSLRVGSVSDRIMKLMSRIRRTGATLAPEAGSQRLRDVINKGVTEEQLLEHTSRLFANGWTQVKLYFMIGLPTETQEDLDAIFDLCCKVAQTAPKGTPRLQVTAAVSPFVPKPHTPFQWERQDSLDEIREKIAYLRSRFATHKKLKMRWHDPEMSWLEGVFSRADRTLARAVERAYRKGALFTSWPEHLELDKWREAFEEEGIDPELCKAGFDLEADLPWDHLNPGVTKRFLKGERRRALEEKLTPDCRYDVCRNCGVCNFDGRVSTLAEAEEKDIRPRMVFDKRDQAEPAGQPEEAVQEAPGQAAQEPQRGKPRPPELPEQLVKKEGHFRIWFEKLGNARFLSTLELTPLFERALRRAKIDVTFSKGFHPMPLLSFGRALPVGVESYWEWFNVFTRKPYTPKEIKEALAGQLPQGFKVLRVEPLSMGKKQPQSVREQFVLDYTGDPARLDEWLAAWRGFAGSDSFVYYRETRKGLREIDARAMAEKVEVGDDGRVEFTFDWREKYVSPLSLVQAVAKEFTLVDFMLVKTAQLFG